eukprot:m.20937 g.20937  ORF g.20937 m.20937 type:complete len:243 (+) comp6312_c0_seq2:1452-2180(+)
MCEQTSRTRQTHNNVPTTRTTTMAAAAFAAVSDGNVDVAGARWVREQPEHWRVKGKVLDIEGLEGSIWATAEFRKQVFNDDAGPVNNVLVTPVAAAGGATTTVRVKTRTPHHGAQAGLLLYASDADWVKLVVEGAKTAGHTMIVLAQQSDFKPVVLAKAKLGEVAAETWIDLRLQSSSNGTVAASFRLVQGGDAAPWQQLDEATASLAADAQPPHTVAIMAHSLGPGAWASFTNLNTSAPTV